MKPDLNNLSTQNGRITGCRSLKYERRKEVPDVSPWIISVTPTSSGSFHVYAKPAKQLALLPLTPFGLLAEATSFADTKTDILLYRSGNPDLNRCPRGFEISGAEKSGPLLLS